MSCTTILVGKKVSLNGGNIIGRNDDSGGHGFTPKKFVVIHPQDQPKIYESTISHCKVSLPDKAYAYCACPSASEKRGIWAACGVNSWNVGMTACETITTNPRVYGSDPLVYYHAATGEVGGLGEEDFVTLVLPYIQSAREGVLRLGSLLEQYGTYEKNGIAFSDEDEIWWFETIGGHHWIAKKVPEDEYAVIVNQLGIDAFDFQDAFNTKKNHLCSESLLEWIERDYLNPSLDPQVFSPRDAFGSNDDKDRIYNTPRLWDIHRRLAQEPNWFEGPEAQFSPESSNIPWSFKPLKKISIDDLEYAFSSHYQGTDWDPYKKTGFIEKKYRPTGINRTNFLGLIEHRPQKEILLWLSFGCGIFTPLTPYYTQVDRTPDYLANTTLKVNTNNAYWNARLIGALADASWSSCSSLIKNYQQLLTHRTRLLLKAYDQKILKAETNDERKKLMEKGNEEVAQALEYYTERVLDDVLRTRSFEMRNAFTLKDV